MKVTCPKCRTTLSTPDDQLPRGKVVSAACPRCGTAITIDMSTAPASSTTTTAPGVAGKPMGEPASYDERGQPHALVCIHESAEQQLVLASLRAAGYAAHVAANPADALERLRFTAYAVVVVREGFDGAAGSASSLSEALAETPMGTRRNTHTVFVGPSVVSHDSRAAFARSVDLAIHPSDLPHFSDALKRSLAETEQMYRVFWETCRALGRR